MHIFWGEISYLNISKSKYNNKNDNYANYDNNDNNDE